MARWATQRGWWEYSLMPMTRTCIMCVLLVLVDNDAWLGVEIRLAYSAWLLFSFYFALTHLLTHNTVTVSASSLDFSGKQAWVMAHRLYFTAYHNRNRCLQSHRRRVSDWQWCVWGSSYIDIVVATAPASYKVIPQSMYVEYKVWRDRNILNHTTPYYTIPRVLSGQHTIESSHVVLTLPPPPPASTALVGSKDVSWFF